MSDPLNSLLTEAFGQSSDQLVRIFHFYAKKLRVSERNDFFSIVALELLKEKNKQDLTAGNHGKEFKRVLERVVKQIVRVAKKRRLREKQVGEEHGYPVPVDSVDFERQKFDLLDKLTDQDLLLLNLWLDGHTLDEIARATDIPRSTVQRNVKRIAKFILTR